MQPASFAYDEASYVAALDQFVDAVGLKGKPYFVATHGFVLGQYGMLWALKNRDDIEKLVVISVPLGSKTKLRPELAAFKNPISFLRPKPEAKFAADMYNATGLAFVIQYADTQAVRSFTLLPHSTTVLGPVTLARSSKLYIFGLLGPRLGSIWVSTSCAPGR